MSIEAELTPDANLELLTAAGTLEIDIMLGVLGKLIEDRDLFTKREIWDEAIDPLLDRRKELESMGDLDE